jgi:hypothetical protein
MGYLIDEVAVGAYDVLLIQRSGGLRVSGKGALRGRNFARRQ